jgi:hypothetical protein
MLDYGAENQFERSEEWWRRWLSRYLLGLPEKIAPSLEDLAVEDETGCDPWLSSG